MNKKLQAELDQQLKIILEHLKDKDPALSEKIKEGLVRMTVPEIGVTSGLADLKYIDFPGREKIYEDLDLYEAIDEFAILLGRGNPIWRECYEEDKDTYEGSLMFYIDDTIEEIPAYIVGNFEHPEELLGESYYIGSH